MAYASRQSSYLLGSVGTILQALAGWWDLSPHSLFSSINPSSTPTHFTLYAGIAIVILAVWRGLHVAQIDASAFVSPIRFVNVAGLKLAGLGSLMQVMAEIWNEIAHNVPLHEPKVNPAYVLLTVGILTVSLGMIVGLTVEYGMMRHGITVASALKRSINSICMVTIFASIWSTAAGAFIYAAQIYRSSLLNWISAALLAIVGTLVIVPAKRSLPRFGSALLIGIVFNGVTYVFLVASAGAPAYIPWGFLPLALFDVLVLALNKVMEFRHAVLLSSTVTGFLFFATYYPFTLLLFPGAFSAQFPLALVLLGSLAGALLGDQVYTGLCSVVLRNVTS